jgi:hypothetical protein
MTRKIAVTCFAALLGFALSAAAQQAPKSSPQTPQTPPSTPQAAPTSPYPSSSSQAEKGDKADKKGSKITGCVQSGTTAGTFELSNIKGKMASESSSSKTVKLVAAAGVDLSQHVGHQVEVTGSWNAASPSAASSGAGAPPSAGAASAGGEKEFNVTDVKMVSATCSAGTN